MYLFRLAKYEDLDDVILMVRERIEWFRSKDILQWREYLIHHPVEEWAQAITNKQLYVVLDDDKVIGCIQFQYYDPEYWDDTYQLYIKKLCTKVGYRKVGKVLIDEAIKLAKEKNFSKIRLDCRSTNKALNKIYEDYGFRLVRSGTLSRYPYPFNLREMEIK